MRNATPGGGAMQFASARIPAGRNALPGPTMSHAPGVRWLPVSFGRVALQVVGIPLRSALNPATSKAVVHWRRVWRCPCSCAEARTAHGASTMTEPRPPYRQRLAEYALVLALTSLALPGSALAGPMFHTVYRSYPKQRAGYPGSAAADFNRDGISDVAVTAGTRIQVFLGARGGSLREVWSGTAPRYQGATAAGDVDDDGFVDIVQMSPGQIFATV